MRPPAIIVSSLTRSFRTYKKARGFIGALKGLFHREYDITTAVSGVSFSVEEGEFVGFLGVNGAGKTTTLKMLSGLLHPSSGSASVLGFTPWERDNAYRRQFSLLMGQKNQLWWDLPAWESLELNSKIYGIEQSKFERTAFQLSEMLCVREKLNVMVRELSLGERMKMELIASLLHKPKVLFLDEPTIGLDVISQKVVREFLKQYNELHKTTILLTSHYMSDIESLCRRVIIIEKGSIFFDGSLSELVGQFADIRIVRFKCEPKNSMSVDQLFHLGPVSQDLDGTFELRVPTRRVTAVCKSILEGPPILDISINEIPIEEVVRNIFSRDHAGRPLDESRSQSPQDPASMLIAA
jgi:ABC-2 type transport system ATP-binding protein